MSSELKPKGVARRAWLHVARFARAIGGLDKWLKASAVGGIAIVLATTWFSDRFIKKAPPVGGSSASLSPALYISRVRQTGCERAALAQQLQGELVAATTLLSRAKSGTGPPLDVADVTAVIDRVRSAGAHGQLVSSRVLARFEGIVPPTAYVKDQDYLKEEWQVTRMLFDELMGVLPENITRRSPALALEILSDPALPLALSGLSSALSGGNAGLKSLGYSAEFKTMYSCSPTL